MELFIQDTGQRLIKMLPERVKLSENETANVAYQKAIITELGDGIAVGYKANIHRRTMIVQDDGIIRVEGDAKNLGEYVVIPKDSTLDDIVDTINGLVDIISSQMLSKA